LKLNSFIILVALPPAWLQVDSSRPGKEPFLLGCIAATSHRIASCS
jgi:hypothetical protein